jgi:hypothetical protein
VTALSLAPGTCPDSYFADVPVTPTTGCKMDIFATVKFNPTATPKATGNKEDVTAVVHLPGNNDVSVPLTWVSGDNWRAFASLPVTPNSMRSLITLNVTQSEGSVHASPCKQGSSNPAECIVKIDDAQRVYGANSLNSGYVHSIEIDRPMPPGATILHANSLPACSTTLTTICSYGLSVTIGVASLHIAQPGERPVTLRILKDTTGNASKNGSLNCDTASGTTLKDELANGCNVAYRVAEGNECDSVKNFSDMAVNPPNPYPCVQEKPGENKQAVAQAMKKRILNDGSSCTGAMDNQWTPGSPDNLPLNDPRRMPVFLTDFGVFTGAGRDFAPVRGFAMFYVTGWSGQEKGNGNKNPVCAANDPVPDDADGYLVGHFIKDVAPPGVSDNNEACDPDALDLCTAVLTR